ncbi:MAG: 30S ribosomal protein S6 [Candidatus Nealsonbacteria bacterium]|nr:30S ribosomal protein S6 [Candidatus Nealsonbacteria bacterium]
MKYYELTYLASPELSEVEVKELQQKINVSVQNKGGILDFSSEPFRINLKYPIKKNNEAYLITLIFSLKQEDIQQLDKEIKTEEKIIRFLLFSKIKAKEPEIEIKETPMEKGIVEPSVTKKTEKKVELKDIEKKLEEILE